jgi:arginase family enzyme
VAAVLHGLVLDERLVGCELVEYNPALDPDRSTARAVERVLGALVDRRSLQGGAPYQSERRGAA